MITRTLCAAVAIFLTSCDDFKPCPTDAPAVGAPLDARSYQSHSIHHADDKLTTWRLDDHLCRGYSRIYYVTVSNETGLVVSIYNGRHGGR